MERRFQVWWYSSSSRAVVRRIPSPVSLGPVDLSLAARFHAACAYQRLRPGAIRL